MIYIHQCSPKLKFYLFADDTNIRFAEKKLKVIETVVNTQLAKLYDWLTSFILNEESPIINLKYVYLTTKKTSMLLLNPRNTLNIFSF